MSAFLILLAFYVLMAGATWVSLWLAARWLRLERRGAGRAGVAAGVWMVAGLGATVGGMMASDYVGGSGVAMTPWVVGAGLQLGVVFVWLRPSVGKGFAAWGIGQGVNVVLVVVYLLVGRGYLVEAYTVPSVGMSPTIMCRYGTTTCPKCGASVYLSVDPDFLRERTRGGMASTAQAACPVCGEWVSVPVASLRGLPADRFLVARYMVPARWDVVAFHYRGGGQDVIYLKRVVGMPGEEVRMSAGGEVSIGGKLVAAPAGVPGKFPWLSLPGGSLAEMFPEGMRPDVPVKVGADEYFVLGDNGANSADSRIWGPIHRGDVVGVVAGIYWPVGRVRVMR